MKYFLVLVCAFFLATNFGFAQSPAKEQPLYIVEGKEISDAEFKTLNPDDIDSIDILKGETAVKQYGEKGKNGVVIVKRKKKNRK